MIHVTTTAATSLPPCAGIRVMINTGFTGTLTLVDANGTTQAVVTNPVTGQNYQYYGLNSTFAVPATLTASATPDLTINVLSRTMS